MGLGDILVKVRASASEWSSDVKAIQRDSKELEKSFKPIQQLAKDVGTGFAVTGAAIVGSLTAMAKQAANYGDAIRDAAIRTNTTTKEMAAFTYLAEQSGTSAEALQKGLLILSRNAAAGADSFKKLGIDTRDSNGQMKSSRDLFGEVSQKLSGMRDGTEKTALMLKLFGKSGAELTEVLAGGKEALDAATAATERFGTAVSQEAADAADKFNDTLNDMKQAQLGLSIAIGTALIPAMTTVASTITDVIVEVQQWTNAHPALVEALAGLGLALTGAGGVLVGLAGVLAILPKLNAALMLLSANPIVLAIAGLVGLTTAAVYFRNEIASGLLNAFAVASTAMAKFAGAAASVASAAGLGGLSDKLRESKFRLEESAKSMKDMSSSFLDATGITIGNTKAVDAWIKTQKQGNVALGLTATEAKKAADAAKKLGEAWAQAFREFKNSSGQLTSEVMAGLKSVEASALKTAKAIVDANDAAWTAMLKDQEYWADQAEAFSNASNAAVNSNLENAKRVNDDIATDIIDKSKKAKEQAAAQYQKLFDSVKATASRTFSDMFEDGKFKFSALGDTIKGIFATLANQILSEMTAQLLTPLVSKISKAMSGLLSNIPGLGGMFGGAGSAAGIMTGPTLAQAAGGAASAGSSVASGAMGLLNSTGIVGGLISGGIAAAGSLIGSMRLEGTMNAVEANTRFTYIELRDTMNQILWPMKDMLDMTGEHAHTMTRQLDDIFKQMSGTGGARIELQNTYAPQFTFYGVPENIQKMMRDTVEPTLLQDLELNARGIMERLIRALRNSGSGVITTPA